MWMYASSLYGQRAPEPFLLEGDNKGESEQRSREDEGGRGSGGLRGVGEDAFFLMVVLL